MYGTHYVQLGTFVGTGAGLVLSAYNFHKLIPVLNDTRCSKTPTHADDVQIANCLRLVGVSNFIFLNLIPK